MSSQGPSSLPVLNFTLSPCLVQLGLTHLQALASHHSCRMPSLCLCPASPQVYVALLEQGLSARHCALIACPNRM